MLELTSTMPRKTLLVSSHGNAIALFLNYLQPSFGYDDWAAMKNPDLFRIEASAGKFAWDRSWRPLVP